MLNKALLDVDVGYLQHSACMLLARYRNRGLQKLLTKCYDFRGSRYSYVGVKTDFAILKLRGLGYKIEMQRELGEIRTTLRRGVGYNEVRYEIELGEIHATLMLGVGYNGVRDFCFR